MSLCQMKALYIAKKRNRKRPDTSKRSVESGESKDLSEFQ